MEVGLGYSRGVDKICPSLLSDLLPVFLIKGKSGVFCVALLDWWYSLSLCYVGKHQSLASRGYTLNNDRWYHG